MWSYYGSKSKIVKMYPKPKYGRIIEPFAGSARYALEYFDNDVMLIEKSPDIVNIWHYLQNCSVKDIATLPTLPAYSKIKREDFDCDGQFLLMKYLIVQGAFRGNYSVSKWGAMRFERNRKNVCENLFKIKHWQIKLGDYADAPNVEATWFIDLPYTVGGHKYPMSSKKIDYPKLGEWCLSRRGQVMVCENGNADWLDFKPLTEMWGSAKKSTEVIWVNEPSRYDNIQLKLIA